jgi:molybdopterin converting factor small subunit
MEVEVELIAYLQKYAPSDKFVFDMEVADDATVSTVVEKLGIPSSEPRLTIVNGRHSQDDNPLKAGDVVVFLTPIEGG